MASAYGIARTYNEFIPPVDLKLLGQAMEVKQQKFDTNFTNIQNTIDLLGNVDLIKDADRQYFGERVKGLIEDINTFGDINLSSNAVSSQIQSHIKQALDENVMNGMEGTAKYRNYMKDVEDYKKNKPEKFNEINRMYGLLPFASWKNDGQAGTTYGSLEYTPFVDIEKKQNDFMAEIVKSKGLGKMDYNDGRGNKITISTWGLSDEEIRRIAESRFDQQDDKQLEINGWYTMGGASTEQAHELLKGHYDLQKTELEHNIAERESSLKAGVSQIEADKLGKEIYAYKTRLKNLGDDMSYLSSSSSAKIGKYFAKEKIIGDMVNIYKEDERSVEKSADEVFFKKATLNLEREAHNLELQKFQHTVNQDAKKDAEEQAKKDLLNRIGSITRGITDPATIKTEDAFKNINQKEILNNSQVNDLINNSKVDAATKKALLGMGTLQEKINTIRNSSQFSEKEKDNAVSILTENIENNQYKKSLYDGLDKVVDDMAMSLGDGKFKNYGDVIKGFSMKYRNTGDIKYLNLMTLALGKANISEEAQNKYIAEVEKLKAGVPEVKTQDGKWIPVSSLTKSQLNNILKNQDVNLYESGIQLRKSSIMAGLSDKTLKTVDVDNSNNPFYKSYTSVLDNHVGDIAENKGIIISETNTAYKSYIELGNAAKGIQGGENNAFDDKSPISIFRKDLGEGKIAYELVQKDRVEVSSYIKNGAAESNSVIIPAQDIEPLFKEMGINFSKEIKEIKVDGVKIKGTRVPTSTSEKNKVLGIYGSNGEENNITKQIIGNDLNYQGKTFNGTPIKELFDNAEKIDYEINDNEDLPYISVNIIYKGINKGSAEYHKSIFTKETLQQLTRYPSLILSNMITLPKNKSNIK